MRCLYPRSVSFLADGKTISWNPAKFSKEYASFKLPCSKCIECRLEYARQWAVRCTHEAQMHEENSFITLTYSDQNLESPKLQYRDFQLFMKKLRDSHQQNQISYFVTGEYGEKEKRPHWHAIIFGWQPSDQEYLYTNDNGDQLFKSPLLDKLWGKNCPKDKPNEIGQVTFKSAGYVARYAAKKLVHGKDDTHDYAPVSKKSSKRAIGRTWLEKYYKDIFNYGKLTLPGGVACTIPRYYEKWLQKNDPPLYDHYLHIKLSQQQKSAEKAEKTLATEIKINDRRIYEEKKPPQITRHEQNKKLIEEKYKRLQAGVQKC